VQSFVWDDFTAKPSNRYEYFFYPIKGKVKNLDRTAKPIQITVQAEPLYDSNDEHDVFFNRGVASSQAFAKRFKNATPDKIEDPEEKNKVLGWLSRDLKDAIAKFIEQAKSGDTLLACFYEFRYKPVADAFKAAIDRGVNVKIIIDAKVNEYTDKDGKFHESFPREDNLRIIKDAKIAQANIIKRQANQDKIQHNKFIVYLRGNSQKPTSVWTGSTNISEGGIFGQTNVGHWVKNEGTAMEFKKYWEILSKDPGGEPEDERSEKIKKNNAYKKEVVAIQGDIESDQISKIPVGVTPIFSPRKGLTMLETYAEMLDSANDYSAITLAFGINDVFKKLLVDNTAKDQITFMLLERKDKPNPKSKKRFTYVGAGNNVYKAWGSYIKDPLYQWTKEVNTRMVGLNQHVAYIHSKFLLVDPLGNDPIVVTGSANFSDASTTYNDENMIIIQGNKRVADIYFTEFNRLFNHYYFRSVYESQKNEDEKSTENNLFLSPTDKWLDKYRQGKLRYKRVKVFCKIQGVKKID
jgi:phosphatidylserine/phosphatidylglycerophosphate/cardiolipin synthase-like enzyme